MRRSHSGRAFVAAAVVLGALVVPVVTATPASATDYPTWQDVQAAKGNEQAKQAEVAKVQDALAGGAGRRRGQVADRARRIRQGRPGRGGTAASHPDRHEPPGPGRPGCADRAARADTGRPARREPVPRRLDEPDDHEDRDGEGPGPAALPARRDGPADDHVDQRARRRIGRCGDRVVARTTRPPGPRRSARGWPRPPRTARQRRSPPRRRPTPPWRRRRTTATSSTRSSRHSRTRRRRPSSSTPSGQAVAAQAAAQARAAAGSSAAAAAGAADGCGRVLRRLVPEHRWRDGRSGRGEGLRPQRPRQLRLGRRPVRLPGVAVDAGVRAGARTP